MKKKTVLSLLLLAGMAGSVAAQPEVKPDKPKKESITIRKNRDDKEKMTIVIDGDKISVNGKPIEDLKDEDIEVIRNKAMSVAPRIKGRIAPGIRMDQFSEDFGKPRPLLGVVSEKNDKGAKIVEVNKESGAEKAGLQKDDIITRINDKQIESSEDLYKTIGEYKAGDKVTVTYLRDGKQLTAAATLGKGENANIRSFKFNGDEFGENFGNSFRNFNFDMPQLRNFNFDMAARKPKLGIAIEDLESHKGVKITDVDDGSPADKAGLKKDDIITDLNGKKVESVDEIKSTVRDTREGDTVKITYQRTGKTYTTDIKFPRKLKTADL